MEGKPSETWIGKILEVVENSKFNIVSGSLAYGGELKTGQKLLVTGVQEGGWLRCKLLSKAQFIREHGVQQSEMERARDPVDGRVESGDRIVWGVSLNFDSEKVRVDA